MTAETLMSPPVLSLLGVILGGLIVGGFAVHNRRRGNAEGKAPSAVELWARQDAQDRELRTMHRRYDRLRDLFRRYVERVQSNGARELSVEESEAIDSDPLEPTSA